MFERTSSGQQNRARFFGVDVTCFVEGGGGQDSTSIDVVYWHAVFDALAPGKTIKFLPRGGKPVLQSLAYGIIEQDIKNTLVAMDRDYDGFLNTIIDDPRVLYTKGYSWENDLFCLNGLLVAYAALSRTAQVGRDAEAFLRTGYETFEADVRRATQADFHALRAGSSVLPRQSPGRVVSLAESGFPQCNYTEIKKLTREANVATKKDRNLRKAVAFRPDIENCVGHILSYAIKILLVAALKRFYRKINCSLDHIVDTSIGHIRKHYMASSRSAKSNYYRNMIRAAIVSTG